MLRVGVVGVGTMGYHHARVYSELAQEHNLELVGVADEDYEKAEKVQKNYGFKPYKNYKELAKENLDAVSIAVPTTKHEKIATKFIENQTNILVEKPISNTLNSAKNIINKANKNNVKLLVGHIERFNPAVIKLKQKIEEGTLGNIVSISAKRVGPISLRMRNVGIITDSGVHDIDVISYLANSEIKKVYAQAGNAKHPANIEDHALITFNLENGKSGTVETNWLTPHKTRKLTATGTKGIAYLDYIDQNLTIYDQESEKKLKIKNKEPLKNELQHLIKTIKQNKKPIINGKEGLHALKVALKAKKSSKKDKAIKIT